MQKHGGKPTHAMHLVTHHFGRWIAADGNLAWQSFKHYRTRKVRKLIGLSGRRFFIGIIIHSKPTTVPDDEAPYT